MFRMEPCAVRRLEKGATFPSKIKQLAEENPDKPAFVFWDKNKKRTVLTRQDLWKKSQKFAAVLRRMGVVRGDIVANVLCNSPEKLITTYGTIFCGAASMHGMVLMADGENIINNWKRSQCKAVILDPHEQNGAADIVNRLKYTDPDTGAIRYNGLPDLKHIIPIVFREDKNSKSFLECLDEEKETFVDTKICEDDNAYILMTSGSTGFSKLVPHSHKTTLGMGKDIAEFLDAKPGDTYLNFRSFGWIGGAPSTYPVSGSKRVAIDFSPGKPENFYSFVVDIFNEERCNSTFLSPFDMQSIIDTLNSGKKLNKLLDMTLTGGGPIHCATMQAIGHFTEQIWVLYGSTEFGFTNAIKVKNTDTFKNCCAGFSLDSVELNVLGEDGEDIPTGQNGEIYIRSPCVAEGYLNDPEKTKESFLSDGWFRTSDIGHIDSQGRLFVYCRKSNAINHKGYLHYPGWIEERINSHPDIQKCMVVGIPDPLNYEDIAVCVITSTQARLTENDVKEFFESLFSEKADHCRPIPAHVFFFDVFPVNSNWKIDRKAVKAEAFKRLGLDAL